jgi:hypothetical protein
MLPNGTVCRAQNGDCDVQEVCDGINAACPVDGFRPNGFVCRAVNGACDVQETCNGSSGACPPDGFRPNGFVCRGSAGPCDVEETCNGFTNACPPDAKQPNGLICRAEAGLCDVAETCNGVSDACPADLFRPAGFTCRGAVSVCDAPETCSGGNALCPADLFAPAGTVCRGLAGPCDAVETCTGSSNACPPDAVAPNSTVCRASAGACDPAEVCNGVLTTCPPDARSPNGSICRPSVGPCDATEVCNGSDAVCPADAPAAAGTVCRASTQPCDLQETCNGVAFTCPADAFVPNGGAPISACPTVANVASYWCQSQACAIQTCSAGACDVDDAYANGCECGNDAAPATCGSALSLGALPVGGSASHAGQLWPNRAKCGNANTEDWLQVTFPSSRGVGAPGAGIPQISISGGAVMDLLANCSGGATSCGSGSNLNATSYSQRDNQSFCPPFGGCGPYLTHSATWNQDVYIRIKMQSEPATCGGYAYTVSASRPTECTNGATRDFDSAEPCDNGCGPGVWRKRQTCRGGVWDAGTNLACTGPSPCEFGCDIICPNSCGLSSLYGFCDTFVCYDSMCNPL